MFDWCYFESSQFFLQERLLKELLLFLSLLSLNTTLTSSVNTSSKRSPCLSETLHLNPDSLVRHCSVLYKWERMTFNWQIWYCVTSVQHLNVLYETTQCTSIITWGFVRMLKPKSWKIEKKFLKNKQTQILKQYLRHLWHFIEFFLEFIVS